MKRHEQTRREGHKRRPSDGRRVCRRCAGRGSYQSAAGPVITCQVCHGSGREPL